MTSAESNRDRSVSEDSLRRRRRDRAQTEADLLEAARKLLEENGVLAGLNLQEVAAEAGVNRGQIYHYYGSRQSLLRAAISEALEESASAVDSHWDQPFVKRRRSIFEWALKHEDMIQLEALLALDGDDEMRLFPALDKTIEALERDQISGDLASDVDAMAAHVATAATYMGYCIFRQVYARNTDIPVEELDRRVLSVFDRMVEGLVGTVEGPSDSPTYPAVEATPTFLDSRE